MEQMPSAFRKEVPKASHQSLGLRRIEKRSSSPSQEFSPFERARRMDQARIWNLAGDIEEALRQIALRRDLEQKKTRGLETAKIMDALRESPIEELGPVGEPGINQVETGLVQTDDGRKIRGYLKPQYGEKVFILDKQTQQAKSVVYTIENSVLRRYEVPFIGSEKKDYDEAAVRRTGENPQVREWAGELYGIDADKVPLDDDEFVIRHVDSGHAFKAEYSASAQDRLLGFDVVKPTALRELDGQMATFQEGIDGEPITLEVLNAVIDKGPAHPGAESLMRLACLDYLNGATDRHANNLFYDKKKRKFWGPDNGFTNGYSRLAEVPGPDKKMQVVTVPLDPYYSFPMEIVQLHASWFLDDEAVQSMKNLFNEVKQYLLMVEGMGPDNLPDSIKQGAAYHALNNIYKLLHEKLGLDGRPTEESRAIAKKEVIEFLKRLNYLIVNRKPPDFPQDIHTCVGMRYWKVKKAA